MAYDGSKETRKELKSVAIGKRGDTIKVAEITSDKGNKSIDIRRWYEDDNGEEKPTQKGLRLGDENIVDIMAAVINSMTTEQLMDLSTEINGEAACILGDTLEEETNEEDNTGDSEES